VLTHIASGPPDTRKVLELGTARGAARSTASPLIHEGLPLDMDSPLGPRTKVGSGNHATHSAGGDVPEREAVVMDFCDLNLTRRGVAAEGEYRQRRTAYAPGDWGVEVLQRHRTLPTTT
jgi:hypothetical protein